MSKTKSVRLCPILVIGSLLVAGCGGSGERLAPVEGTVTLDGEPLANARVEFELSAENPSYGKVSGSAAYGRTDAKGRYKLKYTHEKNGAPVGKHVVRITTRDTTIDAEGNEVQVPERLPRKYNLDSELTAEVKPESNNIPFALELAPSSGDEK